MPEMPQPEIVNELVSEVMPKLLSNEELVNKTKMRGRQDSYMQFGQPAGLEAGLETLYREYKDANPQEFIPNTEQVKRVEGQIKVAEMEIVGLNEERKAFLEEMARKAAHLAKDMQELKEKLKLAKEQHLETHLGKNPLHYLTLATLIGGGFFLWVIYTMFVYKGLFWELPITNGDALKSEASNPSLFKTGFLLEGIKNFLPPLTVFALLAFAVALHKILTSEKLQNSKKYVASLLTVLILAADVAIALNIHEKQNRILDLTGQPALIWYRDAQFWQVMCWGFGMTMVWGVLLYFYELMLLEANPKISLNRKLAAYEAEQELLKKEELEQRAYRETEDKRLRQLIKDKELHKCFLEAEKERKAIIYQSSERFHMVLRAYYEGWLSCVLPMQISPDGCKAVMDGFLNSHFSSSDTTGMRKA